MIPEPRDYQFRSMESVRQGIRDGHLRQILCIPTGGGKTICSAYLIAEAVAKGSKAAFVCDRVALVNQTSKVFTKFGITHGVAQSKNTFGRSLPVQICSAQTIEARGFWPDLDLIIVDECHSQRKAVLEFVTAIGKPVIGLTATPFSAGLAQTYSRVVNVTTTDKLIADKWLAPLKVYAAKEIDMKGAKTTGGEWLSSEVEQRGSKIVGDIVAEWQDKTDKHFSGPVKTIGFSATVEHGEELCRAFQAAGHDFRQVSYKDGNDESRAKLIEAFRRGEVLGLISCEALAKGFDVPDIQCGIAARPYRKSLAAHIQQIGRVMRAAPNKDFALWLDHAGNYLGFLDETLEFFAQGVNELDDGERGRVVRKQFRATEAPKCHRCGYVWGLDEEADLCPSCGLERGRGRSRVAVAPGRLEEVEGAAGRNQDWAADKRFVWQHIQRIATERRPGDPKAARKFALAQYRNWFDEWPHGNYRPAWAPADPRVESRVRRQLNKWRRRQYAIQRSVKARAPA